MITFVHVADVHFGVENYGKIDPKTGIHTRLLDFYQAFTFCIDFAIEKKVDFFIFAGDAYKTAHPTPTQQHLLLKCLLRLYQANIPVIIVVGNHDNPLSFGKAHSLDVFSELPVDGFHVIDKPQTINLQTPHGPVQIVGIPWPTRNSLALSHKHQTSSAAEITTYISQAVAHIIAELAQKLDTNIPAVLTSHLTVSSGIFSGSEKRAIYGSDPMLLPSEIAIQPFDYVALGHLHRHQNVNPHGYPPVIYAGSIERVDFGERNEDKGFCYVSLQNKEKTEYEFIKTPTRPFIQVEVTIQEGSDETNQIINELTKYDLTDAVVKIVYYTTKNTHINLKQIHAACQKALYVVGVIPVYTASQTKTRYSGIQVNTNLGAMLQAYFETKPELKNKKEQLIEQALLLEQEAQAQLQSEEAE